MSKTSSSKTLTEAVAVFEDPGSLEAAIDELLSSGFNRAELSLLANEDVVDEKLGHLYDRVSELEDDPEAPRTAYIPTETIGDAEGAVMGAFIYVTGGVVAAVAAGSGGTLAGVIAATAIAGGAGGLVGSVFAKFVGDHHARRIQEQLDHGGLLLWVRTRDELHEKNAVGILKRHSGQDVHLHPLA